MTVPIFHLLLTSFISSISIIFIRVHFTVHTTPCTHCQLLHSLSSFILLDFVKPASSALFNSNLPPLPSQLLNSQRWLVKNFQPLLTGLTWNLQQQTSSGASVQPGSHTQFSPINSFSSFATMTISYFFICPQNPRNSSLVLLLNWWPCFLVLWERSNQWSTFLLPTTVSVYLPAFVLMILPLFSWWNEQTVSSSTQDQLLHMWTASIPVPHSRLCSCHQVLSLTPVSPIFLSLLNHFHQHKNTL